MVHDLHEHGHGPILLPPSPLVFSRRFLAIIWQPRAPLRAAWWHVSSGPRSNGQRPVHTFRKTLSHTPRVLLSSPSAPVGSRPRGTGHVAAERARPDYWGVGQHHTDHPTAGRRASAAAADER